MTAPVRDPSVLALQLARLLIDTIRLAPSKWCRDTVSDLTPLLDAASVALLPGSVVALHEVRHAADRLASSLFLREGAGGAWPVELQLPYDAATTIRRACEVNVRALLPLIIRDVRFVLERARANPERVDALVQLACAAPVPERRIDDGSLGGHLEGDDGPPSDSPTDAIRHPFPVSS